MRFFLMSQGTFNPKIRFLGQKMCPVAKYGHTDTHIQTDRITTVSTFRGFRIVFFNLSSRIGTMKFVFQSLTFLTTIFLRKRTG